MTLRTFRLVCKSKGCKMVIEMRLAVEPTSGQHEYDNLGRKEVHIMDVVEVVEED